MAEAGRLRRLRRWGRGLAALALLALIGAAVLFQPAAHWLIEREMTSALDARVRIERLRVSPFAGTLQASGLSIIERQGGQPLLRIRDVGIEVRLRRLWRRELLVTRVKLEQPEAWLALTPDGFRWLPVAVSPSTAPPRLAFTLEELTLTGGRIHVSDRRRTPEHPEAIQDVEASLRDLSTREDRRESRQALRLTGRWRGMTVAMEGWIAPLAARRAFYLPVRIAHADLGQVAGVLPAGLAPAGLAGAAEVAAEVGGQEVGGEWQVQGSVRIEARQVAARPRPDLAVRSQSLRLTGQGHWSPKVIGFSRLSLELAGAVIEAGGRLRASVNRLMARGQADLDHRGLLVPEMRVEATGLGVGRSGEPVSIAIGRVVAAGGTDQRAGTVRVERVGLADVNVRVVRQADGSLDVGGWNGGAAQPVAGTGNGRPLYWEVLRLDVERAGLDLTDRTSRPERSLAIRNARLRLGGATSDPAQPIAFELSADTSAARAIAVSGTWVRTPMRLQAKASVQDMDLPALRAWLPAGLPLELSSGRTSLDLQVDMRNGRDGLTGTGAADLRLKGLDVGSDSIGAFAAEDLDVTLGRIQAAGAGLATLSLEAEGRLHGRMVRGRLGGSGRVRTAEASTADVEVTLGRIRTAPGPGGSRLLTLQGVAAFRDLQAKAPGYGVDSLGVQEAGADISRLIAGLGPGGGLMEMAGRVTLTRAEGETSGLPVRTWRVAGIRVGRWQLRTSPLRLSLGSVEVDDPEVQAVRAVGGLRSPAGGPPGNGLPPVRLDRLIVRNGRVAFRDEAVQPAWTGALNRVEAVVEGLQLDADAPASFRIAAKEAEGAEVRVNGRLRPGTWSGEIHAEVDTLDVLRPAPYLPAVLTRVVRGGTASGALDFTLRSDGQGLQVTGTGDVTLSPLELGDVARRLTLLLVDKVQAQVEQFSLDPLRLRLGTVRLEQPWIAVGRDRDGSRPGLRLLEELRRSEGAGSGAGGAAPSVSVRLLTLSDGTAEIEDRAVQPRFRDQARNLAVTVEDLSTEEDRKASVSLKGELSDRSTVALHGFILPLPGNLYLDLDGEVRDLNLHRLNAYTARVTSYRLEQGKLYSRVHYRIEQNRLEAENLIRIDQLALGQQVEPVDRFEAIVGIPLALAVSLLQDSSGEIVLRVPVRGDLSHPDFDLAQVIETAIKNALMQLITAPFRLIGQVFTLGGRIGALEIDPVLFAPGSWTLDGTARAHLADLGVVMRERPTMKIKLSGMAYVESDADGLRAQKLERELQHIAREPGVRSREDALDRLFLRTFGASVGTLTEQDKYARLKAAQRITRREVEDLPDARILSIYDYLAGTEKIERDRMFLAEGKLYRTAEGGGDWARRAEITVLQP